MAAYTTVRRELLNVALLAFVPVGEVVDSVTVAKGTWPDAAPTTNYTNYLIAEVETIKAKREFDTEEFKIPKNTGNYFTDKETSLKSVIFEGETAKTNSVFKQLEHALASVPAVGTALTPYVGTNDYKEGVVLLELQNKGGTVTERIQVWGKLRLVDPGTIGPATRKLKFEIEVDFTATNNTYLLVA